MHEYEVYRADYGEINILIERLYGICVLHINHVSKETRSSILGCNYIMVVNLLY